MRQPQITILVLTYNQQATIGRTLDSLLAQQTSLSYEILIGEDASTDDTRRVCEEYQQRHPDKIRLMPKAPNKGLIANYFDCLQEARGEWIADCPGDDYWVDPLKLEREGRVLRDYPQVMLVHTAWTSSPRPEDNAVAPDANPPIYITHGRNMMEEYLSTSGAPIIHLCTALYRRAPIVELLESRPACLRGDNFSVEDLPVVMACLQRGQVAYLPIATLHYSMDEPSISHQPNLRKAFDYTRRALITRHTLASMYDIAPRAMQRYYRPAISYLLSLAYRLGDPSLRDTTTALASSLGIKLPLKARLRLLIMRCGPLWGLMAKSSGQVLREGRR
ncbi:MAG: glycosyltransferase family 2 protein [Bacteroidales bacterium]|nr:glycosyltransferase family 2 protein [Bacteroidales bacterium]